jgi:hypothetical protein
MARATQRIADADVMSRATSQANEYLNDSNRTKAYFYGNLGDSIERRYGEYGSMLGGGNDAFDGVFGPNQNWNAQGFGNYFGTGLINGLGRMHSGPQSGGGGGFTYLKRFSSNSTFNHSLIASCMLAYLGYGVVRNVIDTYANFAAEGIEIDHPDESVRNFYRSWFKKVKGKERVYSMLLNLFVSGNAFIHRRWATLDDSEKRAMKRAKASEVVNDMLVLRGKRKDKTIQRAESNFIDWYLSKKEVRLNKEFDVLTNKAQGAAPPPPEEEDLPENKEKRIPWGYTFLNPLQMEIRGSRVRGEHYWIMAVDKRDTLEIARGLGMRTNQDLGTTEINLPKEFVSRVKKYQGPGSGYSAEVQLNNEELSVTQAPGKWDWFDWAIPFVFPALRALNFKDCLRNMEMRACQSVINSIFLFKLGNIEKGMPAEDEHFERFADMLQQPAQAMHILWNEAVEGEVLQPDIQGIFDVQKHESADRDILTALGIPEVLLGGKGGNFSNSYISVATVLERLESYRDIVSDWLMGEAKIIADAMGFQKLPTIRFGRTSLRDEKAYQAFVTGLYDRNILSADSLLREANTTSDIEVAKLEEEKKVRSKNVFEPRGPFIKEPKPAPGAKVPGGGTPAKKPGGTGGPGGRPTNTGTGPTGKQSNPRGPKGQSVADLLDIQEVLNRRGRAMLDQVEDFCNSGLLRAKAVDRPGLKHLKQLRAEERERLEQMIYNVFSHMPPPPNDDPLQDDFIINMLNSDACARVKADVLNVYTDKVAEYSKTFGKAPTREMRRQFIVSAWTQAAIMTQLNGNF